MKSKQKRKEVVGRKEGSKEEGRKEGEREVEKGRLNIYNQGTGCSLLNIVFFSKVCNLTFA